MVDLNPSMAALDAPMILLDGVARILALADADWFQPAVGTIQQTASLSEVVMASRFVWLPSNLGNVPVPMLSLSVQPIVRSNMPTQFFQAIFAISSSP